MASVEFLCDGGFYPPSLMVSAAICEALDPELTANWYYKFEGDLVCDPGFDGVVLSELCAMHAALSVLHRHRTKIASCLIVFDSVAAFHKIHHHHEMEGQSGGLLRYEENAVAFHICDMLLNIAHNNVRVIFRHKRTFTRWNSADKSDWLAHTATQEIVAATDLQHVHPHVLPVENLPFWFPAASPTHRKMHFLAWRRLRFNVVQEGCRPDLPHYSLSLSS